jgi:actin-related protein
MDPLVRPAVVLDCGTGAVRAGLAGGETPRVVVANAVGRPKHARVMAGGALADGGPMFVGAKAAAHRGALSLSHPMERGAVAPGRWGDMEAVWRHVYDGSEGLGVNPRDQPVRAPRQGAAAGRWAHAAVLLLQLPGSSASHRPPRPLPPGPPLVACSCC